MASRAPRVREAAPDLHAQSWQRDGIFPFPQEERRLPVHNRGHGPDRNRQPLPGDSVGGHVLRSHAAGDTFSW